ncbi:hypothetical protein AMR41_11065 [Hapalosiphon sp. MRB220]|nr:hypothetical protein AMR41_11065 [Hapalosiphon sp. MRB220]
MADNQEHLENFPSRIRQQLETLINKMTLDREKYKQIVNEHYKTLDETNQFFPIGRGDNRDNVKADLILYDELVTHCLRAGDADILYAWGINSLYKEEGLSRLASKNMKIYRDAFEQSINDSQHPFEKMCYTILKDVFQALLEKSKGDKSSKLSR